MLSAIDQRNNSIIITSQSYGGHCDIRLYSIANEHYNPDSHASLLLCPNGYRIRVEFRGWFYHCKIDVKAVFYLISRATFGFSVRAPAWKLNRSINDALKEALKRIPGSYVIGL